MRIFLNSIKFKPASVLKKLRFFLLRLIIGDMYIVANAYIQVLDEDGWCVDHTNPSMLSICKKYQRQDAYILANNIHCKSREIKISRGGAK